MEKSLKEVQKEIKQIVDGLIQEEGWEIITLDDLRNQNEWNRFITIVNNDHKYYIRSRSTGQFVFDTWLFGEDEIHICCGWVGFSLKCSDFNNEPDGLKILAIDRDKFFNEA